VCSTSKEPWLAAKKMTPPWPSKSFNLGHACVRCVAFSPSGSQLAFCINTCDTDQCIVNIWDRWGKETLLEGQDEDMHCLECSLDGECLASGSDDGSIRIWHAESLHATASQTHRETPTRTPKQADKSLLVSRHSVFVALSFSRTDSNMLASGEHDGKIKAWNVTEQACICSCNSGRGSIHSLFFAGGADVACLAAASRGCVIRLWRAESSSDLASETMWEADPRESSSRDDAVFSPSGSYLAASFCTRTTKKTTAALCQLETMTKTHSVVMPGFIAACFALSPDSKQPVVGNSKGRIRLLQTDDFSVQRDLGASARQPVWSVAFDPSCQFLAFGFNEGMLELGSL
jgi:WD40 repeat protein